MAALSHVKSDTIGDFTGTITGFNSQGSTTTIVATDLVRPVDWNSAHNFFQTITGDTLGQSTASGTNLVFGGTNGVNLSLSTAASAATMYVAANLAPGAELFALGGNTVFSTIGQNSINFQRFINQSNVSFNNLEFRVSGSTVSSTNSQVAAHTYNYGLYTRQTGASSTQYSLIASSQLVMTMSFNSNTAAGYTISQGAASFTTTSGGTAVMSALTGFKHFYLPFTSTITAGGQYAIGMHMSSATTGGTSPFRMGVKMLTEYNNLTIGKIGTGGATATNASHVGEFAQGIYSATSGGLPNTLALSGLTNNASQARMYVQFDV